MSSENEIEEMTIGGQNLEGTEPAAEQTMEGDSPMRSVASLFGLGELAGNMQNAYMPTAAGEPQLMPLMAQGGVELHDGVADMTVMQNSPRTAFNGAEYGVEEEDDGRHIDGPTSYAEKVMECLSPGQVRKLAGLTIEYVKDDVPLEKWPMHEPERIVWLIRNMLKNRDNVVAQGMQVHRVAFEKEQKRCQRLSQEIVEALEDARLAQEAENFAKQEAAEFIAQMEAAGEEVEELRGYLATATQELENLQDYVETMEREMAGMRTELSSFQAARMSGASGYGRRATLLRSDGNLTITGVLQSLKETPSSRTTYNPAQQQQYAEALDILAAQVQIDGENNIQDRMVRTPLKATDLQTVLKEVKEVITKLPKFTQADGEKPEKLVAYVLEVLGHLQQQRTALMDAMRASQDAGGSSTKAMSAYFEIRNRALDAASTQLAKDNIAAAAGDDGSILTKIVEVAFASVSPALAREMAGDIHQHGIRELANKIHVGLASFAAAIRLMTKADPMEMADAFFELALEGSSVFINKECKCLGSSEVFFVERLTTYEAKFGTINAAMYLRACKVRALLKDSKGDQTISACNRALHAKGLYQQELLSWTTLAAVFDEFYEAHVEYERTHGRAKIDARNQKQVLLLTNGTEPRANEAAAGQRKKGVTFMAAAEEGKMVAFARKGEEAGAAGCPSCGLSHRGPCTKQENMCAKYDQAAPYMAKFVNGKTEKER